MRDGHRDQWRESFEVRSYERGKKDHLHDNESPSCMGGRKEKGDRGLRGDLCVYAPRLVSFCLHFGTLLATGVELLVLFYALELESSSLLCLWNNLGFLASLPRKHLIQFGSLTFVGCGTMAYSVTETL